MGVDVRHGDSREVLKSLPKASVDAVVTDPPYALVSIQKRFGKPGSAATRDGDVYSRSSAGFMGKQWDTGETAFDVGFWKEVWRVLKPGGHVAAFGGTRTYHRLACAIEDAGFEIRDMIGWLYGSGFPKSHDVAKALDKRGGVWRGRAGPAVEGDAKRAFGQHYERTPKGGAVTDDGKSWEGWGTALKPSQEPIVLGRKPLIGTVAQNVLTHGTGALNVDGCRVAYVSEEDAAAAAAAAAQRVCQDGPGIYGGLSGDGPKNEEQHQRAAASLDGFLANQDKGRWPANLIHDGSDEVAAVFPDAGGAQAPVTGDEPSAKTDGVFGAYAGRAASDRRDGGGSAARFFYSAKATKADRLSSKHPTVKPVDLMAWLCRLITPPGGTVLDPFAGSGTTGMACIREGFDAVLIEREAEYVADIKARLDHISGADCPLFAPIAGGTGDD